MPWIIAGGMLVSAVVGGIASANASSNALSGRQMQAQAMEDQTQLGREQLDWNKEQYGKWEDRFDPIFGDMMDALDKDLEPNYGQIAGDVSSAFQSQRGQERRNLMRYGVRPQDGSFAGADRQYGIREAAAHVGARSQARESKRGLEYNRLASVAGMGYGIQPSIIGGVNNAAGNLGRSYGNQATQYGNIASMWENTAASNAYGAASAIGGMDWQGMWNSTKGWFNQGSTFTPTGATVAGSGGQTPQQYYGVANSDRRLKKNIAHVGVLNGHDIYTWEWNDIAIERGVTDVPFGVIAQEVPEQFTFMVDGYLMVDYRRLFGGK